MHETPAEQPPRQHKVHQSLIRTPLYAGVEKGFLLFEVCTVGFLFFVIGFHAIAIAVALVWVLLVHPTMAWICAKDPLLAMLYVRSLSGKDFYTPHASVRGTPLKAKPAIPALK